MLVAMAAHRWTHDFRHRSARERRGTADIRVHRAWAGEDRPWRWGGLGNLGGWPPRGGRRSTCWTERRRRIAARIPPLTNGEFPMRVAA